MDIEIPGMGGVDDGGGGGAAVADAPAADSVVDDAAAPTPDGTEETPAEGAESDAAAAAGDEGAPKGEDDLSDIETDGRKIDAKTRTEIAELKKTNPEAAKKWAEAYFRNQALVKETGTKTPSEAIAQVRAMKATIDSLGGEKGIGELQTEVQDYRNEIDQFAKGDPALIKTLGEANPEGLAKAGNNSLDWLAMNKPDLYKNTLLPHVDKYLDSVNLDPTLQKLVALTKEGKGQEVYDLLNEVVAWRAGQKEKVKSLSTAATAEDPREKEYQQKRKELDDEKASIFQRAVETDVNRANNTIIDKEVNALVKELGLSPEGRSHFRNGVISRTWKALANDPNYIRQVRAKRAAGDTGATADFIHKAFADIFPEQFRKHRNEIYPARGSGKPAPKADAGANGKGKTPPINIAAGQRPKHDQVDWDKTPMTMWLTGKAYLKDGRLVQGFKDAPANRL